ncbi:2-hydroxyacyl-CoA lyase [Linum grandiflorum]
MSNTMANTWPMVMISGSCDQNDVGRGDFQELNQLEAVKPFSKFSVKAKHIKEIPNCVVQVLDWVVSDRPGGCYLDLPTDVLHQTLSESEAEELLTSTSMEKRNSKGNDVKSTEIQRVVDLLRRAERPLIVFGKGAAYARAEDELKKLVDRTGIPFLPTPMGKGLLPDTHELAASFKEFSL